MKPKGEPELLDLQRRFAAHLRDPSTPPPPGLEDRRLEVYRELFFNNVAELLRGTFPVLSSILGGERWRRLVRDFYRDHRCRTPLFLEVPHEFVEYLDARQARADDPPFLTELAHYEAVELALGVDPTDLSTIAVDPTGDLLAGVPLLSPLAWPLAYRYPVHRLSPAFQPAAPPPEPSCYIVRRDRHDRVGFLQANAVTLRLAQRLGEFPDLTGAGQLEALAAELPQLDPATVRNGGADALSRFLAEDVVLGTRRP